MIILSGNDLFVKILKVLVVGDNAFMIVAMVQSAVCHVSGKEVLKGEQRDVMEES